MQKAQQRDAARQNKYAFRRNVFPAEAFGAYDISSRPVSPPGSRAGTTASSRQSSAPASPVTATFPGRSASAASTRANGVANGGSNGYASNPHAHSRDPSATRSECATPVEDEEDVAYMTIDEIINGTKATQGEGGFPGLMGLVNAYLNSLNVDLTTKCELRRYLDLIKLRAKGTSALSRGIALVHSAVCSEVDA